MNISISSVTRFAVTGSVCVLFSAAAMAASLSLNPPDSVGPLQWKISGTCVPGDGPVKLKIRLAGTTGPAATAAGGSGTCKAGGLTKSYILDMTGKASGVWDVAVRQNGDTSNIVQVTVP